MQYKSLHRSIICGVILGNYVAACMLAVHVKNYNDCGKRYEKNCPGGASFSGSSCGMGLKKPK